MHRGWWILSALACACVSLPERPPLAVLEGRVVDPQGRGVADVQIDYGTENTYHERAAFTDDHGRFQFLIAPEMLKAPQATVLFFLDGRPAASLLAGELPEEVRLRRSP